MLNEFAPEKMGEKQLQIIKDIISDDNRINVIIGSIRTGKTLFATVAFCEYILNNIADGKFEYGVISFSHTTAYKNVGVRIVGYFKTLGINVVYKNKELYHKNFIIRLFGANNKGSIGSIQGSTLRGVLIDEAPILDNSTIEMAMQRPLTFGNKGKIVLIGNPEGSESHPFYKRWIKEKIKHTSVLQLNMLDNPMFNQKDLDYFKTIYTETMYNRKILGLWTVSTGAVYPKYPKVKKLDNYDFINIGIDYGEVDATSAVACGFKEDETYWFDQYYHKNGDLGKYNTINDYLDEIIEFCNNIEKQYSCKINIICETSPSSLYNLLKGSTKLNQRINVKKVNKKKVNHKSPNAIKERIDVVNFLIALDKLFIGSEDLPLYDAIRNAVWKSENERLDNGETDIDSLDSAEYCIISEFNYYYKNVLKEIVNGDNL